MDSRVTRNYILLAVVKRLELAHRLKERPYPLVTILGDPITYRDSIIRLKIELVEIEVKKKKIVILFNILLLGKDKAVLGMPFLKEFNLKIN
jgi:hypothetical protein